MCFGVVRFALAASNNPPLCDQPILNHPSLVRSLSFSHLAKLASSGKLQPLRSQSSALVTSAVYDPIDQPFPAGRLLLQPQPGASPSNSLQRAAPALRQELFQPSRRLSNSPEFPADWARYSRLPGQEPPCATESLSLPGPGPPSWPSPRLWAQLPHIQLIPSRPPPIPSG